MVTWEVSRVAVCGVCVTCAGCPCLPVLWLTLSAQSDSLRTFGNGWWSYVTYGLPEGGSPARREVVVRAYQSASVYARGAALGARAALWTAQTMIMGPRAGTIATSAVNLPVVSARKMAHFFSRRSK